MKKREKDKLAHDIKKHNSTTCCLQETQHTGKDTQRQQVEEWRMIHQTKSWNSHTHI
jgi:hypothetical protein